jgi:hypothetical protein
VSDETGVERLERPLTVGLVEAVEHPAHEPDHEAAARAASQVVWPVPQPRSSTRLSVPMAARLISLS